jgi:uncharacterized protein (TIGR02246 family)
MNDEQAIRDLIATWLGATQAGDHATVLELMADEVVFLMPGHPPMRGKAAFAAAQAGTMPFDIEATSRIEEVGVHGELAHVWTTLTVVMKPKDGGTPVTRSGPTLSLLRKEAGRWVIFRDANMLAGRP